MPITDCWESILVATTRECNLNCNFCQVKKRRGRLPPESAVKFINTLRGFSGFGDFTVKLQGGEPLIYWKELRYIITNTAMSGNRIILTTNGHLLDDGKILFLRDNCVDLVFSIDSEKWDLKNQAGLMRKIERLRKLGYLSKTAFNITITGNFQKEAVGIIKRILKVGCRDLRIFPAFYCHWSKDELLKLGDTFSEIAKLSGAGVKAGVRYPSQPKQLREFVSRMDSPAIPLCVSRVILDADENIYFSDALLFKLFEGWKRALCLGNIRSKNWAGKIEWLKSSRGNVAALREIARKIYLLESGEEKLRINRALLARYRAFTESYSRSLLANIPKKA